MPGKGRYWIDSCIVYKRVHQVQYILTQAFLSNNITRTLLIVQQIRPVFFREAWNCSNKGSILWCVSHRLNTSRPWLQNTEKITVKAEEKQSTPYSKLTAKKAAGMLNSAFTGHWVSRQAVICDYLLLWMVHLFHSHCSSHPSSVLYFPVCILSWNQDNKPLWAKNIVWLWL